MHGLSLKKKKKRNRGSDKISPALLVYKFLMRLFFSLSLRTIERMGIIPRTCTGGHVNRFDHSQE